MRKIDHFLWTEKYRPKTIDECILPEDLKETFRQYVQAGQLPNLLLAGTAGVGKTTVARALCSEIGAEYMFINGSEESGIDVLRNKIRQFASTISLTDSKKVVIIDEGEHLNANSTQPALRAFIEEFASNCRFIITCNFKNRVIEPLHSRCAVIDFKIQPADKAEMMKQFAQRIVRILKQENITFDMKVIAQLIQKHYPDFRRIINELQRYSVSGTIDTGIFVNLTEDNYKALWSAMKTKKFNDVRKWVAVNSDIDMAQLYHNLYCKADDFVVPPSLPQLIITLAEYQYRSAFVADQEINTMACLTEIMSGVTFK